MINTIDWKLARKICNELATMDPEYPQIGDRCVGILNGIVIDIFHNFSTSEAKVRTNDGKELWCLLTKLKKVKSTEDIKSITKTLLNLWETKDINHGGIWGDSFELTVKTLKSTLLYSYRIC